MQPQFASAGAALVAAAVSAKSFPFSRHGNHGNNHGNHGNYHRNHDGSHVNHVNHHVIMVIIMVNRGRIFRQNGNRGPHALACASFSKVPIFVP